MDTYEPKVTPNSVESNWMGLSSAPAAAGFSDKSMEISF